jgi:NADH-quinone oxidoreductase subunit F
VIATEERRIKSPDDLDQLRKELKSSQSAVTKSVHVCTGPGCAIKGSRKLFDLFRQAAEETAQKVHIESKCVGCHGLCELGPIVVVQPGDIFYQRVEEPDVEEIFRETVMADRLVERLL